MQGEDGGCSEFLFGDEREPRGQMLDVMKVHEPNSLSGAQSAMREKSHPSHEYGAACSWLACEQWAGEKPHLVMTFRKA